MGPTWPFLLMYKSYDMRHAGFRRLTVVNKTPRDLGHHSEAFHPDRHQIIQTEVDNLLRASFIRELKYPEWLANVVVVPKK